MIRTSIPLVLASLSLISVLPQVTSYAKVSRNGQEGADAGLDPDPWTISNGTRSESRSFQNIAITVSPVYVPPKVSSLKNGEAIDYAPVRYSTLDHEMIAKLSAKKQIQDRYHPPTLHPYKDKESSSDAKDSSKPVGRPSDPPTGPTSPGAFDFSKSTFSESYDYEPPDYLSSKPISKPPDYLGDKPISKPLSMDDYGDSDMNDKPSDSYKPDSYYGNHDYSDYPPGRPYNNDAAPKPMEYSGHLDRPPYGSHNDNDDDNDDDDNGDGLHDDHSYGHHGHHHDFHHEVIYDHIPEYHEHAEEMNDQRLNKKPYSYYFIGRKLWYIPLYFSIYFIIYIAALVLKSIARHKITFPEHLADAVNHHRSYDQTWWDYTGSILQSIETFAEKYGKVS